MKKGKVILGMSGGVDSSVAATLLKEQGYEVLGVTLILLPPECDTKRQDACCGTQALNDARSVCNYLGIRHWALNLHDSFRKRIIDYFISEYISGKTPNPCIRCNGDIKFPALLYAADIVGAEHISTGHFVRVREENGRYVILKGVDNLKDQSYFLFELKQKTLSRCLFPIGGITKKESREFAVESGLPVSGKPESQEICFIDENGQESFFKETNPESLRAGPILNTDGKKLGTHKGLPLYTIGQRRGMGIGGGEPIYVISINPETNSITVGSDDMLRAEGLTAGDICWTSGIPKSFPFKANVKIRYNHEGTDAMISKEDSDFIRIIFNAPQRAVTPGQAVVFYDGDVLTGGGWIQKSISRNNKKTSS